MSHLDELSLDGIIVPADSVERKSVRSETHKAYPYDAFMIPIGNVINSVGGYRTEPWWCPPERLPHLKELCEPFIKNGFKLHIGDKSKSSGDVHDFEKGYKPQVIMSVYQERGRNKPFCPNTKMIPALVNDVMVWFTIDNVEKAKKILKERTDIPVALVADAVLYDTNDEYRKVFDLANEYFIHYYMHGEPRKLYMSEDDVEREIHDV